MCVCEREREKERQREKEREKDVADVRGFVRLLLTEMNIYVSTFLFGFHLTSP